MTHGGSIQPDDELQVRGGFSRRGFVKGAAAGAAAVTLLSSWPEKLRAQESAAGSRFSPGLSVPLGACRDEAVLDACTSAASALGARTLRFPLDWASVERVDGSYDWSGYDNLHRSLVWNGLRCLPAIYNAPDWIDGAEVGVTPGGLRYPRGEVALNALGDFAVNTAKAFSAYGPHIAGVEIWPRANATGSTQIIRPEDYGHMVRSTALTVSALCVEGQQVHERIAVIGGSLVADAAESGAPYAEAGSPGPVESEISVDLLGPYSASELKDAALVATERVAGLGYEGFRLNVAAPRVETGEDAQVLQDVALGLGREDCLGVTINPIHPQFGDELAEDSVAFGNGTPLLTDDWEVTSAFAAIEKVWNGTS